MSHFGDYMDGVPVKVSEKYKRPPRIELPYTVGECISRAQQAVDTAQYCPTFETNVLGKIKELRSAKETKRNERRHRLQLLEEAKQRKLDEIAAAEAEERLKQLSVSEVSYPSTEEISALSPDEQPEHGAESTATQTNSPEDASFAYPSGSGAGAAPDILKPIQVQATYQQSNLLDDPDPLQDLKMNAKVSRVPQYSNMDTLTFKDFENDTSSPFDNVELKTINDMELLAQVLQSERDTAGSCSNPQNYVPDPYAMPNCASQAHLDGLSYMPGPYVEPSVQAPNVIYSPHHYATNGYYIPDCDNPIPIDNLNLYVPNYQYYVPENPYVVDPNYYGNPATAVPDVSQVPNGYIPEPYYFHYPHVPMQYPPTYDRHSQNLHAINADELTVQNQTESTDTSRNVQSVKSRSRSVPDIVKELNDEIAMAKLRANERSHNASPAPKLVPRSCSSSDKKERKHKRKEHLPNPLGELPPKLQDMCQKVSTMGFPLDRVARICSVIGDNDKKIIEGLLLLDELMDLGFPESRVTAALTKHEFNKDKALDELVS